VRESASSQFRQRAKHNGSIEDKGCGGEGEFRGIGFLKRTVGKEKKRGVANSLPKKTVKKKKKKSRKVTGSRGKKFMEKTNYGRDSRRSMQKRKAKRVLKRKAVKKGGAPLRNGRARPRASFGKKIN